LSVLSVREVRPYAAPMSPAYHGNNQPRG
jgi:hypothetical protein